MPVDSDQQQLVIQEEAGPIQSVSVLEIFARLARDPNIDPARIAQLMEMHREAERWQARKDFIAAFSRLKFPPIRKTAKGHNAKYAPYEEIQSVIDPILASEGFTLTFSSGELTAHGIPIHGKLSHIAGHHEPGTLWLPRDKSGSMNEIQGAGSTISYGQRYVAKMMLNLRFIGDDDDAGSRSYIDESGANNIINMIAETGMDDKAQALFLKYMNAEKVETIFARDYPKAMSALQAKLRKKREGK